MLKSPVIPTLFTVLAMIMGCQSFQVSVKEKTNQKAELKKNSLSFCPKNTRFIQKKGDVILCGKLTRSHFQNLQLLKKIAPKKYYVIKKWPVKQKFKYKNGLWLENIDLKLEKNYYYLSQVRKWQWTCEDKKCHLASLCQENDFIKDPFPHLAEKIQVLAADKKNLHLAKENVLERLLISSMNQNNKSKKILENYDQWFLKDQISYKRAEYFKQILTQSTNCPITAPKLAKNEEDHVNSQN